MRPEPRENPPKSVTLENLKWDHDSTFGDSARAPRGSLSAASQADRAWGPKSFASAPSHISSPPSIARKPSPTRRATDRAYPTPPPVRPKKESHPRRRRNLDLTSRTQWRTERGRARGSVI
ncbi:predicted protein [Micromonas commoda]|uniref:Uncharacterized protein n=1 Tax=Micromonas commoda (strain RCC299 / NOUM17 / CCMP2709) TaxID=296587 RepID=C1E757_MICCC|nr:predicted protein [Micromonas commoda]ACO63922.1 predicted protein [Micromonas commoda]|eukprot:XP_002502664.1 predicted protein [Micromonas commoda]